VGFEDMPYFHRTFVERLGLTPAQLGRRVTVEGGSKG
jgi:AraC-like DNA-binding protein